MTSRRRRGRRLFGGGDSGAAVAERSAPLAPGRSTVDAAAVIAGPALRAALRGEFSLARAIVAGYDDETAAALAEAADRLAVLCREPREAA